MSAIAAVGLEKHFAVAPGAAPALALERFEVAAGAACAVLGPNGAGKTTLLKLLGLLLARDAGHLALLGIEVGDRPPLALRRRLTYLGQAPYLFRGTVREEVARGLRWRGTPARARRAAADEALARVGLGALAERSTRALSGGEALRVALARALALAPEILLLDEPTANLDAAATTALEEALRGARGRTTVVLATHDRRFAERYAGQIVELAAGRQVG